MSWVNVYVHLVFTTKNRYPFLDSPELRKRVFKHIKSNSSEKGIWLDCVNGFSDHAHCLVSLGKEQSISKLTQLIKGESSFWINQNKLTEGKFSWQDDYWAIGVGESYLKKVRSYIHNQELYHLSKSFESEIDFLMERYGSKSKI